MGGSEDEVEEIVQKAWGSPKHQSYASAARAEQRKGPARVDPARRREEAYWSCRNALRIRPVNEGNGKEALVSYLKDHLLMSDSSVETLGLEKTTVERVPYGPKSRHQKEMIVRFPTTEARDVVKSMARNLADKGSDYGVRLEIPNHLKTAMQAIQATSYDIKQRHPEAKRNVLYDDGSQDLVLDFATSEGAPWRRITSAQARQAKAGRKKRGDADGRNVGDSELEEILGRGRDGDEDEIQELDE